MATPQLFGFRSLLLAGVALALLPLGACVPVPDSDRRLATPYVQRTESGYELGLLECDPSSIRDVQVRVYNQERIIWSTKAQEDAPDRRTLVLFQSSPGYDSKGQTPEPIAGVFDVSTFRGGVVFRTGLPMGWVAYPDTDVPLPRDQYLDLPDSLFDC